MHSKWTVLAAVIHVLQSTASGQLSITSVDWTGTIVWSNCFATLPFNNTNRPIYSVDWSTSPTGVWQRVALLTNGYSFTADESLRRSQTNLLFRVEWVNSTSAPPLGVYEITATNSAGGIDLFGQITLNSMNRESVQGHWEIDSPFGAGFTNGVASGQVSASYVQLYLHAHAEGPYTLYGSYNGVGFSGAWMTCGIICFPQGNYTARRICP